MGDRSDPTIEATVEKLIAESSDRSKTFEKALEALRDLTAKLVREYEP